MVAVGMAPTVVGVPRSLPIVSVDSVCCLGTDVG